MAKSREYVEKKMSDRISTAGAYLRSAMEEADDPVDVILADPEKYAKKLADNLVQSIKEGAYASGLKRAKDRNAWREAQDRAGAHFEERTDDIVAHSMESYDARAKCIESARKAISDMPDKTRTQRAERSKKYQITVGECMDKIFGRKGE